MRIYDHLFFDLDNTLWDFDKNSRLALFETLNEFGLSNNKISHEDFYNSYKELNESLWDAYRKKQISKPELIRTRFKNTLNLFQINNIDPVLMNEAYLKNMANQTILVDGAIETLDYLKAKGYQMHIITNGFTDVQNQKLLTSGLRKYFDKVFTSEAIEYPKPDVRIFQHALKSCNVKKEKSLMIGDSWDVDIKGAKEFGIDQVFFQKENQNYFLLNLNANQYTNNIFLLESHTNSKTFSTSSLIYLLEIL